MTPQQLRQRTKAFAIAIIRFCRSLPKTDQARTISWQLLRFGPAIGANYRATCRSRSDKDFIAKLGVFIKEADETAFRLEVLVEAEIVRAAATKSLDKEVDELVRIFVSSRETARRNRRLRRAAKRPNDQTQTENLEPRTQNPNH